MVLKVWLALAIEMAIFGAILFGAAGTFRWPAAWVYLFLFFGWAAAITAALAKHDPELLRERTRPFFQKNQPWWDKAILGGMGVLFVAWLVLMGLDARFGWSEMAPWIQIAGAAGLLVSMWICWLAFRENTFLAPVVRIQRERGQRVISTGPYAVVRHPLYAGAVLLFLCTALVLGSWYGLAWSGLLIAGLMCRTVLEERELRGALEGYPEYMERVRYRLVPWVW